LKIHALPIHRGDDDHNIRSKKGLTEHGRFWLYRFGKPRSPAKAVVTPHVNAHPQPRPLINLVITRARP